MEISQKTAHNLLSFRHFKGVSHTYFPLDVSLKSIKLFLESFVHQLLGDLRYSCNNGVYLKSIVCLCSVFTAQGG